MFAAMRAMRQDKVDILAVYHSHPTTAPIPSKTDLARNYSPGVMNLIISLASGEPFVRSWWLFEQAYLEAEWTIVDEKRS
jgi:proteasome lid subunit RPN8/RPN11